MTWIDDVEGTPSEEDQKAFWALSTDGVLTANPSILRIMPRWLFTIHVNAGMSRYKTAAQARVGLEKCLMLPPGTDDETLLAAAGGASLEVYAQSVLDELAASDAIACALAEEAERRRA